MPRENLIGEEGKGLKIALVTLNTGRLTLPADVRRHRQAVPRDRAAAGRTSASSGACRSGSTRRSRTTSPTWPRPPSRWTRSAKLASAMADRGGYDIRLEAAAAKEWNTVRALGDRSTRTLQIRGGRGYETERSLAGARRVADPRRAGDARLPHQPDLRGLERDHAPLHGARGGRQAPPGRGRDDRPEERQAARSWRRCRRSSASTPVVPAAVAAGARRAVALSATSGALAPHLRFVERSCRKLARESFHGMAVYQAKMERKQGFLFRCVDVVMELFAMAATISRTRQMLDDARTPRRERALELADLFCRTRQPQGPPALPRSLEQRRRRQEPASRRA